MGGSIPACAGEPQTFPLLTARAGVYPRVCGGTRVPYPPERDDIGLSPRVRGNRAYRCQPTPDGWSIPACAGEPIGVADFDDQGTVYPRVCGGTPRTFRRSDKSGGLSPRVRGNRVTVCDHEIVPGSIPACAGEPSRALTSTRRSAVYPRVCGGTANGDFADADDKGLSPRVRGNPAAGHGGGHAARSIPACAGEPITARGVIQAQQVYPRVCGGTVLIGL